MADFSSINIDELINISTIILRNSDWDRTASDVKDELAKLEAVESEEFDHWFELIFTFWKEAVLNQTKPKDVELLLQDKGVKTEDVHRISEVWKTEAPATLKKAKLVSASGRPQVEDMRWGVELERATRFNSPKREPIIHFKFLTDQGGKNIRIDIDQLIKLHLTLKDVQSHVDSVFT